MLRAAALLVCSVAVICDDLLALLSVWQLLRGRVVWLALVC